MDPRSQERPQGDTNLPGTSQEDTDKTQGRDKNKRKCRFSAEEHEILVREVTEHQHQLFITSKLPIGRREAIWQQIVDKINSVAEVRRTVTECKKRWHDCKRRTKEKMARNRKAALQTGGGSPAPQEALDKMEEMVAAVIPEEIITGIAGQYSADYQETTHMQGAGAMVGGRGTDDAAVGPCAAEGPAGVAVIPVSTVAAVGVVAAVVANAGPPWLKALRTHVALS
ncbi:hypothetical protein NDU88_002467 [Pleurodeles waltl]|uniref:Nuclear apoptosis-inducing factor 1 n=1 Tax=Pleurodeles waltl TaxID=8319 RepID=A0AAV7SCJ1_PLEWA|nr:hypothetical protein NDU88_002467 [Pleurodeles waltl]